MKSNYKRLGKYIQQVKVKNSDGGTKSLLGINIDKYFMPSVANVVGTDLTRYKIVKKGQFSCNRMHVGRDKRLPVALSNQEDDFIVSPAYDVFEITDKLMMWFSRKEFDRNAWFYTDADVRGGLHWDAFCNMQLPVPEIEKQKAIVKEYNTIVNRIKLNEQLNQKLEETAQAIYKQWFVDFEFPDENGKAYKSNGGEMVWNEEFGKDIPVGWGNKKLRILIEVINGYAFKSHEFLEVGAYPILKIKNITPPNVSIDEVSYYNGELTPRLKKTIVNSGDILISMTGSGANQINSAVGQVGRYNHFILALLNQRVGKIKPIKGIKCSEYVYQFISRENIQMALLAGSTGSANQANISPSQIENLPTILPNEILLGKFEDVCSAIRNKVILNDKFKTCLDLLKDMSLLNNMKKELA
jgi:type I restriction enzyme S subunit